MRKKLVLRIIFIIFILQTQTLFAQDRNAEFRQELNRNNIRNIERLLERRVKQMDLTYCMYFTINSETHDTGFNKANCLDVVRLLVRYGADVNRTYYSDFSGSNWGYPLENAVRQRQSMAVIQFLLDSGANPNLAASTPPVRQAYYNNDTTLVNMLLDRGANIGNILLPAAERGDIEFLRRIVSSGFQVRSEQGAEALRWAAYGGKLESVVFLVENGVNINARSNDSRDAIQRAIPLGATAASVAYDQGEMEIYNYLLANGAIEFERRQVVQQPSAPTTAPVQSTTFIVQQPSAPAQSSPPPASSTPTLQNGRYAWSNSGVNMTMTLNTAGLVSAYLNNSSIGVWHGTYRINGNQLVITVTAATGDYTNLRGQTYSYTINSSTSFSGSGETWVRTGSF